MFAIISSRYLQCAYLQAPECYFQTNLQTRDYWYLRNYKIDRRKALSEEEEEDNNDNKNVHYKQVSFVLE